MGNPRKLPVFLISVMKCCNRKQGRATVEVVTGREEEEEEEKSWELHRVKPITSAGVGDSGKRRRKAC